MKTIRLIPSLIAIALAAPVAAAPGSVRDFQLRPSPTPSAAPQVQGPVDLEGTPIAPRPIVRPTPTPSATTAPSAAPTNATPSPGPATTSTPNRTTSQTGGSSGGRQSATPSAQTPAMRVPPQAAQTSGSLSAQAPNTADSLGISDESAPANTQVPSATTPAPAQPSAAQPADLQSDGFNWLGWLILIAGVALLGLGGMLFWRKRQRAAETVPQIEMPLVREFSGAAEDAEADETAPANTKAPPEQFVNTKTKFQAKVAAQSLSRSVMNATLVYQLELQNLGSSKIEDISVYADVVCAHGKAPVSEQLADENSKLTFASFVQEVRVRDSQEVKGEFRLPLGQIKIIVQGSAKLFVPLLRLRIEAEGIDTIIQTFVVGIRPEGSKGKLLPFRLDEMAQTYRNIGLRQLG